ncbi:MAG: carboxypeptidase-like regulatory domain-containing protein [Acidobacteriota bacterium]|nr:carboxypeptidase-like regulatory domain-containing protein [Acidobacteriota bacterium]
MSEKIQLRQKSRKIFGGAFLTALLLAPVYSAPNETFASTTGGEPKSNATAALGTIRGSVRDDKGAPIAGAIIALWRDGMASVRQITSRPDGSFIARVLPGRYSLTAMAEGFSVVSLSDVSVERSDEIAFRFNLVRTGSGNTLPEKRADRKSSKWLLRSNATRRSIYQQNEGTGEVLADLENPEAAENETAEPETDSRGAAQTVVETYFAGGAANQNYYGVNFATVQPVNENLDLVFAGQTGIGENAPNRFETSARVRLNEKHRVTFNVGAAKLGSVQLDGDLEESDLGQISFQAFDEWRVRDGVIFVFGVDYARFVGASGTDSIAPRLGLQFETDARTRLNFAYTTQTEQRTWQQAAELEDSRILFRQPTFDSYAIADRQVLMPKLRRLEFGIERVLDNASNLEASAFFDTTTNRGISFLQLPLSENANEDNPFLTAAQNGSSQGIRVVYSRRLNELFSTALGYSFGRGQSLSANGITNPADLFDDALFQTFAAQVSANFDTGTEVRAVYRVSPRGAVFAIDPFAGRMAFYDPSLSLLVTQKLPTLGLPVRAKAMFDARNLLDVQTATANGETALRLNSSRRFLRGGIAVRF